MFANSLLPINDILDGANKPKTTMSKQDVWLATKMHFLGNVFCSLIILGNENVLQKGRKTDVNFKHDKIGEWNPSKNSYGLFDKYDTFEKADEPFFAQIQLNVTHRGDWWNDIRAKSAHPVNPEKSCNPV